MKSGQRKDVTENSPRALCSNRSSQIILAVLILVSLNIVACYDWTLSMILKPFRWLRRLGCPSSCQITVLPRQNAGERHSGKERAAA